MDTRIEQYEPFPPSVELIVSGGEYILRCVTKIPGDTCLGVTSVYANSDLTSVRTPLGAFLEKSPYAYNCCVRSGDLKTYNLWTLRTINMGECITIW